MSKYTKELLQNTVSKSQSFAEMLRHLGVKQSGGMHAYIKGLVKKLGIDTQHFKSQAWNKGMTSSNKIPAQDFFVYDKYNGRKTKTRHLKRALIESGRPYICEKCGRDNEWNGKELTLQIDHIDGDWLNNRSTNLRFLCPNCHSQTETFSSKNRNKAL